MPSNEKTSKDVASTASKLLRDQSSSKDVRSVSASVLSQAADKPKAKLTRGEKRRKKA
jgi:hypothetical protein